MTLPQINESEIRTRADGRSWQRGLGYLNNDRVTDVVWRGSDSGTLTAAVEGSDYDPYSVRVEIVNHAIASAFCSCPFSQGGDCKHIVAALLFVLRQPDAVEERPALREQLEKLDRNELISLLINLANENPSIVDSVEVLSEHLSGSESAEGSTPQVSPVNVNLLRRQIRADMRNAIDTGYDSWGEESWYDSNLGSALEPAIAQIRELLEGGAVDQALTVLELVTEAWDDGADSIDSYFREYFEESGNEFLDDLALVWAEALLMADLDPQQRAKWVEKLENWSETIFAGDALELSACAARHGWDYPPLVAAMAGNITEMGAWEGEVPHFADRLADVRLNILEQRGDFDAAYNLAQAEGEFLRSLQYLIKLDRIDEAIAEAMEYLEQPRHIHVVAQALLDAGKIDKAFALAQHGLALETNTGENDYSYPSASWGVADAKASLAAWLRDEAEKHHQPALALASAREALHYDTNLTNYLCLQEIAGARWAELKAEALGIVNQTPGSEEKVEIFLHEGMLEAAVKTVDAMQYFYDIVPVLDAVQHEYPEWAFKHCAKRAESIMDAGKAARYDEAAEWLRRGRDILRPAGFEKQWASYLSGVMDKHQRKYKLMPMLRAIA